MPRVVGCSFAWFLLRSSAFMLRGGSFNDGTTKNTRHWGSREKTSKKLSVITDLGNVVNKDEGTDENIRSRINFELCEDQIPSLHRKIRIFGTDLKYVGYSCMTLKHGVSRNQMLKKNF